MTCSALLPAVLLLIAVTAVVVRLRDESLLFVHQASTVLPAATSGSWRVAEAHHALRNHRWCLSYDAAAGRIEAQELDSSSTAQQCGGVRSLVWEWGASGINATRTEEFQPHGGSVIWYHRAVLTDAELSESAASCCGHVELSGWWRDGPHMQSNAEVLHFRGSSVAGTDGGRRWIVFGAQQGFYNQLPRDAKAAGQEALATKFKKFINSSDAWGLFVALYNRSHNETSSTEQRAPDFLSTQCYWFGEVFSIGEDVNGTFYSTCGAVVFWSTSAREFAAFAQSLNSSVLVYCLVVLIFLVGMWRQRLFSIHSRTRMERVSQWQLLVLFMWVSLGLFFSEALLHASPLCKKALDLLYTLLMVAGVGCVFFYSVIEHEVRRDAPQNRMRQSMIIFAAVFCVQVLPMIFRTGMTKPFGLFLAAFSFWAPQLYLAFADQGSKGLTPELILAASLMPVTYFGTLVVAPKALMLPSADPRVPFGAGLVVLTEAGILLLARKYGAHRLIPSWLAPWRHRYVVPRGPVAIDDECSICKTALGDGNQGNFETWVTPCRHYFHGPCLNMWMEQRMECPLCRAKLPDP